MPQPTRPHRALVIALGAWLVCVVAGFVLLADYASEAGPKTDASDWPADTSLPEPDGPTLVLFLHPECGCSRATLAELRRLLPRLAVQPTLHILLSGQGDTLRANAASVTGATLHDDLDTSEARRFGAATSGHAFVYDAAGRLRFHGGITGARGHEGPNAGISAVRAHLAGLPEPLRETPVFGCLIFDPEREEAHDV